MIENLSFGPLIGGGFLILLGIWLLKQARQDLKDFERSKSWPSVKGTMLKSEVWRPKSTSAHRVWSVAYEYRVADKSYKGNRVALYTPLYEEIQEWQESRQIGDTVNVYYDPAKPNRSVLFRGGREQKKYGEIILCLGAIIVGIFIAIYGGVLGRLS